MQRLFLMRTENHDNYLSHHPTRPPVLRPTGQPPGIKKKKKDGSQKEETGNKKH